MLDFITELKLAAKLYYFIPPLLLMLIVPTIFVFIYSAIFRKILPTKIFNFFISPVVLLGFYIWAVPMKIGFYEFFRAMF